MDNMAPYSPVQIQAICKARKLGLTTAIENCVAYFIDQEPAEQLYSTASEQLAKDWSSKKVSHVIDSLGIRGKLFAADQNAKSRRTGDRMFTKEYIGGALDIITAGSLMARRALDKRCLWIDETDGIAADTATGEGNWAEIEIAHTNSYGARRKITLFGSPATIESSLIWRYYSEGDCRKFLVSCPNCGRLIELKLETEGDAAWGLKAETKGGEIIDAYYLCEYCHEPIWNNDKLIFYSAAPFCRKDPKKKCETARWEPTRKADPTYRSYQINALYSPVGMLSFKAVVLKRQKAEDGGPDAMRSYVNIYAGLPYRDEGSRPKLAAVLALRGHYHQWTVPDGVIFLTAGIDVQRGSRKDERNPPRIEMTVFGTGLGYRGWLIGHRAFYGETTDAFDGAWEEFYRWLEKTNFVFTRRDGHPFEPVLNFIDAGDAADDRSVEVCRFCGRIPPGTAFPVKGFSGLSVRKKEKGDLPGGKRRFRPANIGPNDELMYEINTNFYKGKLYGSLNIPRQAEDPQRPGFFDFPMEADEEYFSQLTGTEKLVDGTFRDVRSRVEALDCMVYALAAADVWLDVKVKEMKRAREAAGLDPVTIEQTNSRMVLEYIASLTGTKKYGA
jgi:phage terminase large subunit GpA-like protein